MAVVVGAAPVEEADVDLLIGANAEVYRRVRRGGWPDLFEFLQEMRTEVLKDPLAAFRAVMKDAPAVDQAVMGEPEWQLVTAEGFREALRPGAEGWTDESQLLVSAWDLAPERVKAAVTWWHGRHDANVPLPAAQRLVRQLPNAELRLWDTGGHLEVYHREPDILADLLQD